MQRHQSQQEKPTEKTTVAEDISFEPFCYEVKAPSLYNERDVCAALKDASMEMLGNAKLKDKTYFVKEHQLVSSLMIVFGWLAIGCGLYCFRLQYNKENKLTILCTALAFWTVALTFFALDYAYLDHLVTSYSLRSPRRNSKNSYGLYLHYDCDEGLVRWVRYDDFSLASNILGGLTRIFKFQHVPYIRGLIYLFHRVRPKVRSFEHSCFVSEPLELSAGATPSKQYSEVCGILALGKQGMDDAGASSKKTKETSGWYLERDVTHYFDENGFVLHQELGEDLKKLVLTQI